MRLILALTTAAIALTACGGEPATMDQLIIGEWDQAAAVDVTDQGMTVTMKDGESEYDADGTAEGEVTISIPQAGDFRVETESTYSIEGDKLKETVTNVTVVPLGESANGAQIAAMLQGQMNTTSTETVQTIVTLDKDTLVVREESTGTLMTFDRD